MFIMCAAVQTRIDYITLIVYIYVQLWIFVVVNGIYFRTSKAASLISMFINICGDNN